MPEQIDGLPHDFPQLSYADTCWPIFMSMHVFVAEALKRKVAEKLALEAWQQEGTERNKLEKYGHDQSARSDWSDQPVHHKLAGHIAHVDRHVHTNSS